MDRSQQMSFKRLWSRGPDGWTAIDCQGGMFGVSVKSPRTFDERAVVEKHASMPGVNLDQANLVQMGKLMHGHGFPLVHLLGRKEYQMFLVDKAAVKAEEMESSLRWSLTPLLDYPSSEANLAWMEIPQTPTANSLRTPQLYVVAARRELVNQRTDLFESAHLTLRAMEIRETGQRNISAAIKAQDAAVCLIYAEPNGVQLTVTYKGELYLERYIRESLFVADEDMTEAVMSQKFDRVALEVQRSIDFVQRNASSIPFDGIFVAPTQSDIGLLAKLKTRLLADVRALDLNSIFEWPNGSDLVRPEVQALYFNALGAALRLKE
mgnify:CR=1 FL=1